MDDDTEQLQNFCVCLSKRGDFGNGPVAKTTVSKKVGEEVSNWFEIERLVDL